jgi:hypothetical protein
MRMTGAARKVRLLLLVLALVFVATQLADIAPRLFQQSHERGHIWTAHLAAQSPELWDWIHQNGEQFGSGGIWRYSDMLKGAGVVRYLSHQPKYDRLADMSCSVGIILSTLREGNPAAEHVGSDISRLMVNKTRARCPQCRAEQFDLGNFKRPAEERVDYVFPGTFDYVIISDVLIYIAWGGWPPLLLRICQPCRQMALSDQVLTMSRNNPAAGSSCCCALLCVTRASRVLILLRRRWRFTEKDEERDLIV